MTRLLNICLSVILITVSVSCEKSSEDYTNYIIGTWKYVDYNIYYDKQELSWEPPHEFLLFLTENNEVWCIYDSTQTYSNYKSYLLFNSNGELYYHNSKEADKFNKRADWSWENGQINLFNREKGYENQLYIVNDTLISLKTWQIYGYQIVNYTEGEDFDFDNYDKLHEMAHVGYYLKCNDVDFLQE